MENTLVRTRTGNKVHQAPKGSSITYCGIRYAMIVKASQMTLSTPCCASCGLSPMLIQALDFFALMR